MSTPPREHPDAGVVTFTPRGEAALERLAASLARGCDGSPASVADILAQVLDADIEQLADTLDDAAEHPDRATTTSPRARQERAVERAVPSQDRPRTFGR